MRISAAAIVALLRCELRRIHVNVSIVGTGHRRRAGVDVIAADVWGGIGLVLAHDQILRNV